MKRHLAAVVALSLFATSVHAQSLKDILATLTGHMSQIAGEGQATLSALNAGDAASACSHLANQSTYLDMADDDLDTMQATLDANTSLSADARADWQYHITDARGSIRQLADANGSNRAKYCS